jgi:hypothetical protein
MEEFFLIFASPESRKEREGRRMRRIPFCFYIFYAMLDNAKEKRQIEINQTGIDRAREVFHLSQAP